MCNVIFSSNNKECNLKAYLGRSFPIDSSGYCIFHSTDIEWKQENNFSKWFLKFFNKVRKDSGLDSYDFRKFIFVSKAGEERLNVFNEEMIDFRRFVFDKEVFFSNSVFEGYTNFSGSIFNREAYFEGAKFRSVDFAGSSFDRLYFKDAEIRGYADFQKCEFNEHVYFNHCKFKKRLYFHRASFNSHTSFKYAEFFRQTNFEDVSYPTDWTVDYSNIVVHPESIVHFKGLNFQNRLFENTTKGKIHFKINEDNIKGNILFESVDMHKIKHFDLLVELAKKEKIEIGVCCGTSYQFYVKNVDDNIKLNVYKVFLECFNRFLSNEYNLLFNVSFKEVESGYQIEFHSKEYIERDRFIDIAYRFKQEFNSILLSQLKKDKPLKALLKVNNKILTPTNKSKISKITEADLEIDVINILMKVKKYHELGFLKRLGKNININILSLPINLNKLD